MEKSTFKDWTLDTLDDTFGLSQILDNKCLLLQKWEKLAETFEIKETERDILVNLQESLQWGGRAWNEFELENKFISPLIMTVRFDDRKISYFLNRPLTGVVGDHELSGVVDGMIATGFRTPRLPFFCMHEYKKSIENAGMPDTQAIAAMLVAREMNENKKPIYGMYIVGLIWNFMVLDGKGYCISQNYDSSTEGIFKVFKMLKALKQIIKTELPES